MRLILSPLSKKELDFVLRILNTETHKSEGVKAFAELEDASRQYSQHAAGKYLRRGSIPWRNADDVELKVLRHQWLKAQEIFHAAIVDQRDKAGLFCHLPAIGLPVQKAPALIREPGDLAMWLVARSVANEQHRLFVKCARRDCGKFGRRARARASSKYCSAECQIIENARRSAERATRKTIKGTESLGIAE